MSHNTYTMLILIYVSYQIFMNRTLLVVVAIVELIMKVGESMSETAKTKDEKQKLNIKVSKRLQQAKEEYEARNGTYSNEKISEDFEREKKLPLAAATVRKHFSGKNVEAVHPLYLEWYAKVFSVSIEYLLTGRTGEFKKEQENSAKSVLEALVFLCSSLHDNMEFRTVEDPQRISLNPSAPNERDLLRDTSETTAIIFRDKAIQSLLKQISLRENEIIPNLGDTVISSTVRAICETIGRDVYNGCICNLSDRPIFFTRHDDIYHETIFGSYDYMTQSECHLLFLEFMDNENLVSCYKTLSNGRDEELNYFSIDELKGNECDGIIAPDALSSCTALSLVIQEIRSRYFRKMLEEKKKGADSNDPIFLDNTFFEDIDEMTTEEMSDYLLRCNHGEE